MHCGGPRAPCAFSPAGCWRWPRGSHALTSAATPCDRQDWCASSPCVFCRAMAGRRRAVGSQRRLGARACMAGRCAAHDHTGRRVLDAPRPRASHPAGPRGGRAWRTTKLLCAPRSAARRTPGASGRWLERSVRVAPGGRTRERGGACALRVHVRDRCVPYLATKCFQRHIEPVA